MTKWIKARAADAVNKEDVIRVDHTTGHAKALINLA